MELEQIKIYRITHIENVPHILQYGITHKNSPNANPNFISIGDKSLIDTRSRKNINVNNGNEYNSQTITLGDFIPFYFGIKMPMLYVIQNGGNFVDKATSPENIIYLVSSVKSVIDANYEYYFSDGHATDNFTTFYDKSKIRNLSNLIDWQAIKASYWGGHDNLNIKRKKQAEFLLAEDLAPNLLVGFGCYNEVAKQKLIAFGIEETIIKIIPNAYF